MTGRLDRSVERVDEKGGIGELGGRTEALDYLVTSGSEMDRGIEVDGSIDSGLVTNVVVG